MKAVALLLLLMTLGQKSWAEAAQSAEILVERHFQLPTILAVEGQYVSYSVTVTNTGTKAIAHMNLWAVFGTNAASGELVAFVIPELRPGENKHFSIGPFKMSRSGEYGLFLGINRDGISSEPNDVFLNYSSKPADSVYVYDEEQIHAITLGAAFAGIGGALLIIYKKRPRG